MRYLPIQCDVNVLLFFLFTLFGYSEPSDMRSCRQERFILHQRPGILKYINIGMKFIKIDIYFFSHFSSNLSTNTVNTLIKSRNYGTGMSHIATNCRMHWKKGKCTTMITLLNSNAPKNSQIQKNRPFRILSELMGRIFTRDRMFPRVFLFSFFPSNK